MSLARLVELAEQGVEYLRQINEREKATQKIASASPSESPSESPSASPSESPSE